MKNNKIIGRPYIGVFVIMIVTLFYNCEIQDNFSYDHSNSNAELGITAWEYIQNNDSLNLLEEAITLTNTQSFYESGSDKTFIAPTNEAFTNYLQDNSYLSLSEVPVPILRNALKYHIVNSFVSFDDPDLMERNNPLPYTTENGQIIYLSHNSGFTGIVNEGTSKQWNIITSNLKSTTGVIHVLPSIVYFSALTTGNDDPDPSITMDTIFPIHDTYINGGSQSGRNFGTDALIKVKNVSDNGLYDRKGYLMFDLSELSDEGVIIDFKLELPIKFTHGKEVDFNVYEVQDTLWSEVGLTFDNATFPTEAPIATITTSKLSSFEFDLIDYLKSLTNKGRVSFMLDGELGSNETDEFYSKENTLGFNPPMLIARLSSKTSVLTIETNTGFSVDSGETFAFDNNVLEVIGAAPEDLTFTIEEAPEYGWLVRGASILKTGDTFTQEDIDVMNLIFISNGSGSSDKIVVSAADKVGATVDNFNIDITIQ